MSTLCESLNQFIDGELTEDECEHVRGHLAICEECASCFQEALQLEVLACETYVDSWVPRLASVSRLRLVEEPPTAAVLVRPRAPSARREHSRGAVRPGLRQQRRAVWGMAAAAGLAAMVYVSLPTGGPSEQLWLAQAPTRRVEARLSLDVLEPHRPFAPMRSDNAAAVEPVPLRELSRLDEQKDAVAIAAAFLVRGDVEQARSFLETASASPDRDNDLAVVAMQRGELYEALRLLDRVLQEQPGHVQARWNRALVLRDLGQKEQAAQAFEQLAARGERGWSEEAACNARSLREHLVP